MKIPYFEFDSLSLGLKKATYHATNLVRRILILLLCTFSVAVVAYCCFAFVFSTDVERSLKRENRMFEKMYPTLVAKDQLLSDGIANLQYKDNDIYEEVFHSTAPNVNPMLTMSVFASDTIPDEQLVVYTKDKSDYLLAKSSEIEDSFEKIYRALAADDFVMPPMVLPLKGITYPQVGASKGMKVNPFLKAYVVHSGLDFIVNRGTPVYASASGVVTPATKNYKKSRGIFVEIEHEGGYVTRYAHLESMTVRPGQTVACGQKIGTVGMSGNAIAPHLHYEILRDGINMDPINYVFASVSPQEYANMLFMAANTLQSMD